MNRSLSVLSVLFLWCGGAFAAMYGDFAVPEAFSPAVRAVSAHGGRVAVEISPPEGKPFVLYLPEEAEDGRPYSGLQTIGLHLPPEAELAFFNVGGRLWVGTRNALSGGSVLYDGYLHKNGLVYNLAFSIDGLPAPDAAVKHALARVRLLPDVNGAPAMEDAVRTVDLFETGDFDELSTLLGGMEKDDAGTWAAHFLRGRLAEAREGPEAARGHYDAAHAQKGDDIETAARAASMRAMTDDDGEGVAELLRLSAMDPDEAVVWEELGKVYLAAGEEEAALGYFGQAACVNPTSEIALYNLSFLHAERKEYEDALRRAREFMHYYSWLPNGTVPDVSGAPGMTAEKVAEILAEPLPLGCIVTYGGTVAALPLCGEEIRVCTELLTIDCPEPVYVDVYVPVVNFDWNWFPDRRPHKPHKPKPGFHKPRPPWGKPGKPGPRPPKPPHPGKPGGPGGPGHPGRPPRPPEGAGPGPRPPAIDPGTPRPPRPPRQSSGGRQRPSEMPRRSSGDITTSTPSASSPSQPAIVLEEAVSVPATSPSVVVTYPGSSDTPWHRGSSSPRHSGRGERGRRHPSSPAASTPAWSDSGSWSPPTVHMPTVEAPKVHTPSVPRHESRPIPASRPSFEGPRGGGGRHRPSGGDYSPPSIPSGGGHSRPSRGGGDHGGGYSPPSIPSGGGGNSRPSRGGGDHGGGRGGRGGRGAGGDFIPPKIDIPKVEVPTFAPPPSTGSVNEVKTLGDILNSRK